MKLNSQQSAALIASTDVHKFDLSISNTIANRNVTIELFNNLYSNTRVYNPSCDPTFFPVSVSVSAFQVAVANQANQYINAYFLGGIDSYVNAGGAVVGNTNSYCFMDQTGTLRYQPGYIAAAQISGILTVQSKQTNYNHVFNTLGQAAIFLREIKVTVAPASSYVQTQLSEDFTFVSQNISSSAAQNATNASTYSNEYVQQTNIVTTPINQPIDPNSGLQYTVILYDGIITNNIQLSMRFVPLTVGMLS